MNPECHCESCYTEQNADKDELWWLTNCRFHVCSICGNKRCPKAFNCFRACTNSNAVGQEFSSWEHVKPISDRAAK